MRALLPWQRVRVEGSSMTPTLLPGDWLLVRHGARVRPGALVLATFRSRADLVVLKRAVAEQDGGWLLTSDNARQGSDSRQYGVADVQAVGVRVWRLTGPLTPGGSRWRSAVRRWWGIAPQRFSPPG
ncbi:MAG TPA: S24 family peptidase [Jatrophihabitans sp.]|uniref:S24 family peptidase n=1 Tax=Jatrophihabitans sp. TaxID=1932789 RepID=UPI002EE946D1